MRKSISPISITLPVLAVYLCLGGIGCKCDGEEPVIEEIIPECIDVSGGVVTLKGRKFYKIESVTVTDATTSYTRVNNREIRLTISAITSSGDKYVSIKTECGIDNKILPIEEEAGIDDVSPTEGDQCGGYPVTITGTNLAGAQVTVEPDDTPFYTEHEVTEDATSGVFTVTGDVAPHDSGVYKVTVKNETCASNQFEFKYIQREDCPEVIADVITIDGGAQVVGIGDFDNDHHNDVVVAFYDTPTVTTFYGDGTGNFPREVSISLNSGDHAVALTVADLNGDDLDDVAIAVDGNYEVDILLQTVAGELALQSETYDTGTKPEGIVAAHLNVDSYIDLAVPVALSQVIYLAGAATGGFSATDLPATALTSPPGGIAAGDPNAEGVSDLYVPYPLISSVAALLNESTAGSFLISLHDNATADAPRAIAFHDVLSDYAGGEVLTVDPNVLTEQMVILGDFTDGVAAYKQAFSVGHDAGMVAGGYFGEGAAGQIAIFIQSLAAPYVDIFPNPPDFADKYGKAIRGLPVSHATGDLDEDGYDDIAIGLSEGTLLEFYLSSQSW